MIIGIMEYVNNGSVTIHVLISNRREYGRAEWAANLTYGQKLFLQLINMVYKLEILGNLMS